MVFFHEDFFWRGRCGLRERNNAVLQIPPRLYEYAYLLSNPSAAFYASGGCELLQ